MRDLADSATELADAIAQRLGAPVDVELRSGAKTALVIIVARNGDRTVQTGMFAADLQAGHVDPAMVEALADGLRGIERPGVEVA